MTKKLTAAQQEVIATVKASAAKFAGKTYEEVYARKEDRTSYTKFVYEMAQKGFYIVYGQKATFDNLVKRGLIETTGEYSCRSQFVKLADTAKTENEEGTKMGTETTQNGLTYEQFQKLAVKHYNEGGDAFVECWSEDDFLNYVAVDGPITEAKAMKMFGIEDEIQTDEREAARYFSGMDNNEEEETMKSTEFTTNSGMTYSISGTRYFKAGLNGKKTRIGKTEYELALDLYNKEHEMCKPEDVDPNDPENAYPTEEQTIEDAQAELDKEPCRVEVNSDLYKPAVINQYGCVDCSHCNVNSCVHRNCMRRNPRSEGGLGECPRLDVEPEQDEAQDPELDQIMEETGLEASDAELERNIRNEQKKPSKPRRSKDIAYEGNGVTLTAKQADFLRELRKTEAYKEDENDMAIEDIAITIGGQFEDKPMTIGAMISTLCEKRLGTRIKAKVGNRTMTLFGLTPSGKDIMNAIK